MNHKKGLTLFSINTITGEIKPAEYIKESVITWEQALLLIHGKGGIARKVMVEKDCVYIEALNAENAKKKYNTRKSRRNRYEDRKD